MICAACGMENAPGKRFCRSCGTSLAAACPACGSAVTPDDRFCGECGTPLGAAAPTPPGAPAARILAPAARVEPATERRLVTVLFADVVGFTTLSEARDSEQVRALLSRYFDVCRRLIELYGGVVEKFIGDAVMAVWGAHSATEDDAERAVRAALDLVAAVTALGDEIGVPNLRVRAGVLTGEATVTIGAVGEGMVAGDVVNTAARVQALADPGHVLVGDSTRRATEPTVVFEDAGEHELKGKIGLHRLWRAVRIVSGARGSLKSEGLEAPFVGRERELRQIKDLFHTCADERRAHLVSVTGIAGIGKSRLVWEFYKYFDGLAQVIYWHRGRCPSYGEGVTYWALADMVRMRCRISEDEPSEAVLAKLGGVLDTHVTDADERAFVEPRVAHLLGVEGGARFEREDLFSAWRLFFERLADVYPTVLAFEDMQWADASLLDFIEHLLEWSRNSPLYVITAARPELVDKRPTWGAGKRNFTSLYLEPLGDGAMRALLDGLVAGLPDALAAQILARSEGVPLYAVETVRMLLDRGHVVQQGSVYRATGPVETLEVPETLHALIAARLDGLSADERLVVQNGAVLGKTFTKDALAAIAGTDDSAYDPILAGLVRKEVLSIQADPRSPEHGQYGFLQDLMRRVAYETLSRRERRLRHLAAAAHVESTVADDDELVEVLAAHYLDAFEAVPDAEDADAVRARARDLFVRAAERAESLGAPGEAQRYFAQAADLADDAESRAGLLDRAGQMATRAGLAESAQARFEEAIALYTAAGNTHAAARVTSRQAYVDERAGRHELAITRMQDALAVIGDDEPDADVALLTVRLGNALLFVGRIPEAAELIERALEMGEALGVPEILIRGWSAKAILVAPRRRREAEMLLRAAAALALEQGSSDRAATALGNLSDLAFGHDRYQDALGYLEQSLELARRAGDRPNIWFATSESTYALYHLGRWDEAMAAFAELPVEQLPSGHVLISPLTSVLPIHLHRGELEDGRTLRDIYARLEDSVDVQERSCFAAGCGILAVAEGRYDEALRWAETAVATEGLMGAWPQNVKLGLLAAVEAALVLGRRDKVEELLRLIEGQPAGMRTPLMAAHAHRFRGRMTADADVAEAEFAAAERLLADLGIPFWLAATQLEHAEALVAHGGDGDIRDLVDASRATFERLRAAPWLERLESLRTPVPETAS
ncbi:MAG TPA: adenylate/guanylate cyclase domain-containing protein [Gaiellales bacterium]